MQSLLFTSPNAICIYWKVHLYFADLKTFNVHVMLSWHKSHYWFWTGSSHQCKICVHTFLCSVMDRLLEVAVDYHIHDLHKNDKIGLLW